MKKFTPAILFVFLLTGCSTVNFSANYFDPPRNYQDEVAQLSDEIERQIPLTFNYKLHIVGDKETQLNGVPEIIGTNIRLPETFIKYVYQNYYDDRNKIIACIIVHEMAHTEFDIASTYKTSHYRTDKKAMELLDKYGELTVMDFYSSLKVMYNYWFARKGVAGHTFNATWNLANLAAVAYVGQGYFVNWFATDMNFRLRKFREDYKLRDKMIYARSKPKKSLEEISNISFKDVFKHDPKVAEERAKFQLAMNQLIKAHPETYGVIDDTDKPGIFASTRYWYKDSQRLENYFMNNEELEEVKKSVEAAENAPYKARAGKSFMALLKVNEEEIPLIKVSCKKAYKFEQDCSAFSGAKRRIRVGSFDQVKVAGTADGKAVLVMGEHLYLSLEPIINVLEKNQINIVKTAKVGEHGQRLKGYVLELDGDGYSILRELEI